MSVQAQTGLGPLNHIGVATTSIEASLATYLKVFGAQPAKSPFVMAEQGVRVCFIDLPNGQIELIEPYGDASPLRSFLDRNPAGGMHHVCYETPDIQAAVSDMEAKGVRVLGPPRIGAHGTPVIFLHPKDMGGVLVELMEPPGGTR
jgi:methylmalonyl-CoA/ethylmalonyl-CoA epimerase